MKEKDPGDFWDDDDEVVGVQPPVRVVLTIAFVMVLIIIGILWTFIGHASAQGLPPGQALPPLGQCGPWADIQAALKRTYKEEPTAAGLVGNEAMVQVYTSPHGATFSVVIIKPDGMACPLVVGNDWIESSSPAAETF